MSLLHPNGGNAHDRRKAARAGLHAVHKQRAKTEAATKNFAALAFTPETVFGVRSYQADAVAKMVHATEMVIHVPRCKGKNCDAAQGEPHSKECIAEHNAVVNAACLSELVAGDQVRNKHTKSVATVIDYKGEGYGVHVKRRDNRKVYWPLSDCEYVGPGNA